MPKRVFEYIVQQQKGRRPFAVATVIETRGSVSARTAAKALIFQQLTGAAIVVSILE